MAFALASTSIPYHIVEREEFQALLHELDPMYEIPSRRTLGRRVEELFEEIKQNLKQKLFEVGRVSLCIDLWTRDNSSESYLAITVHFMEPNLAFIRNSLLAMELCPLPHTSENILCLTKNLLKPYEFCLDNKKVYKVITDNGANVKKSFRDFTEETEFDEIEFVPDVLDPNLEAESLENFGDLLEELVGPKKRTNCYDHTLCCEMRVSFFMES